MEIFFADDSLQDSRRSGASHVVSFGGVLIKEAELKPLSAQMDTIAAKYGIPAGEEIKWSPARGSYIHTSLGGKDRENCYREMLDSAAGRGVQALVVCIHVPDKKKDYSWATGDCITYLFERLCMQLKRNGSNGIIVSDEPGGGRAEDLALLQLFLEQIQSGTEYIKECDNLVLNMLTTPSKLVRQLQLADLVVGITTGMVCANTKYAGPLFPVVQSMLIKSPAGYVGGSGLKIGPNGWENLYHWVLGEHALVRGGGAMGWPLPSPRLNYYADPLIP